VADLLASPYKGISDIPRVLGEAEEECVRQTLIEFQELATYRLSFAAQWEEIASLILPAYRNTFQYGSWNWPGQKKTEMQIDATGMLANERFSAICDSLLDAAQHDVARARAGRSQPQEDQAGAALVRASQPHPVPIPLPTGGELCWTEQCQLPTARCVRHPRDVRGRVRRSRGLSPRH
jgi:hypothetical protein